jgi:hypothetical protein
MISCKAPILCFQIVQWFQRRSFFLNNHSGTMLIKLTMDYCDHHLGFIIHTNTGTMKRNIQGTFLPHLLSNDSVA